MGFVCSPICDRWCACLQARSRRPRAAPAPPARPAHLPVLRAGARLSVALRAGPHPLALAVAVWGPPRWPRRSVLRQGHVADHLQTSLAF